MTYAFREFDIDIDSINCHLIINGQYKRLPKCTKLKKVSYFPGFEAVQQSNSGNKQHRLTGKQND